MKPTGSRTPYKKNHNSLQIKISRRNPGSQPIPETLKRAEKKAAEKAEKKETEKKAAIEEEKKKAYFLSRDRWWEMKAKREVGMTAAGMTVAGMVEHPLSPEEDDFRCIKIMGRTRCPNGKHGYSNFCFTHERLR